MTPELIGTPLDLTVRIVRECAAVRPSMRHPISGSHAKRGWLRKLRQQPRPQSEELRQRSDIDLLRDFDRVIDFDTKVPHAAFDFRVTQRSRAIMHLS